MTRHRTAWLLVLPALLAVPAAAGGPPTRAEIERTMGLRSEGDLVRGQLDTVGFVVTAEQAEDAVTAAFEAEREALEADRRLLGGGAVAVVAPHDDHLYAGRVLIHATEAVTAPRLILIGVFHKARLWNLSGRLVFDRFQAWHGPWGPVPADPLRERLLAEMPREDVVVDDAMHCREHSLEALVPFLQHGRPGRSIVPILVPYVTWERLEELADHLSGALARVMEREGWRLGRDLAVVISADLVHYGPDFEHAPFGTDTAAYERAVARDRDLIAAHLEGPLRPERLRALYEALVDPADPRVYRIPWCGRFSIPFGLELVRRTAARTGAPVPEGRLLRYGTSLSEPELAVRPETRAAGLGYTAPSNLFHWVGYGAIAWR